MTKHVLIVDDDVSVRDSLKKVLQEVGYKVTVAAGGLEALGRCMQEQIDLVLLDVNLPNQSGWEVFEPLSTHYPLLPIIVITGLPNQYPMALASGAGALMEKPIEVPPLLKTMEELLSEPEESRLRRLRGRQFDTRFVPASCKLFLAKV